MLRVPFGFVNAHVPPIMCNSVFIVADQSRFSLTRCSYRFITAVAAAVRQYSRRGFSLCDISGYLRWCFMVSYFPPRVYGGVRRRLSSASLNVRRARVVPEMKVVQWSPCGARGVKFLCERRIKLAKGPSVIARWLWLRCVFSATSAAIRSARVGSVGQRASS